MFLDDVAADPVGALEDVFDFLGVQLVDPSGKEASIYWRVTHERVRCLAHKHVFAYS